MKNWPFLSLAAVLVVNEAVAAGGATAPYNEAVKVVNGKRVVEVAPFPPHMKGAVVAFKRPGQAAYAGSVTTVETDEGLMDCLGTYWYHPKACSPSTFGQVKLARTWTVKRDGKWFACVSQAQPTQCIPLIADGKLRSLPTVIE